MAPMPFTPEITSKQARLRSHDALSMLRRLDFYREEMIITTNQIAARGVPLRELVWLYTPDEQAVLTLDEAGRLLGDASLIAKLMHYRERHPQQLLTALIRDGVLVVRAVSCGAVLEHPTSGSVASVKAPPVLPQGKRAVVSPTTSSKIWERHRDEKDDHTLLMPAVTGETLRMFSLMNNRFGELKQLTSDLLAIGMHTEHIFWIITPTCSFVVERHSAPGMLPPNLAAQLAEIPPMAGHINAVYVGLTKIVWDHYPVESDYSAAAE